MFEIILIWICFLLFLWYYKTVDLKAPPIYKGCWPFVGHAHLFLKCNTNELLMDLLNSFSKECEKLGGVMRWYFGPRSFYWITDPEDAFRIGKVNVDKHHFYDFGEKIFGNGLFTASGSTWKTHKKLLSPAFSLRTFSNNPSINRETRKHLTKFDTKVGKGPLDLYTDIRLMILKTLFSTLFISFEKDEKFYKDHLKNVDEALEILIKRFRTIFYHSNFLYKFTKLSKKEEVMEKINDKFTEEVCRKYVYKELVAKDNKLNKTVIINRKREIKETDTDKVFLDLLLDLHDEGKLTMKEVKYEINTFMTAALDTTSWAVNNVLVLLGTHLDVQDKVVKELTKVLGTEDRDIDKQDLSNLVYLEAVIKEYLRLYPPAPLTFRILEEPVQLRTHTLPAGSSCVLSLNGVNRDLWWGEDRDTFRPERWFEREELGNYFAGFSIGRRSCIGKTYAMLSLKTMLAHIVRRYRVAADANQLRFKFDFVMKPVAGHFVSIERRKYNTVENK